MYTKDDIMLVLADKREQSLKVYPGQVCLNCKQPPIHLDKNEIVNFDDAVFEGHIYSQAGLDEFEISRHCEYCFDKITWEFDELFVDPDEEEDE